MFSVEFYIGEEGIDEICDIFLGREVKSQDLLEHWIPEHRQWTANVGTKYFN